MITSPRYDVIIWDVDGTLLDSSEGILASVRHTLACLNLPPVSEVLLPEFIGPPLQHSFERLCGLPEAAAERATSIFRSHYLTENIGKARLYAGMREVLEKTAKLGIRHAIATNKRQDAAEKICELTGLTPFLSSIHGNNDASSWRKSDLIRACLSDLTIPAGRALMIGDTVLDGEGAKESGIDFLGVLYGFGFKTPTDLAPLPHIGTAISPPGILPFIY